MDHPTHTLRIALVQLNGLTSAAAFGPYGAKPQLDAPPMYDTGMNDLRDPEWVARLETAIPKAWEAAAAVLRDAGLL